MEADRRRRGVGAPRGPGGGVVEGSGRAVRLYVADERGEETKFKTTPKGISTLAARDYKI